MAEKHGIKVAQQGYDVSGADYQMLFSSEWPVLKILFQGSVTVADKTQNVKLFTHNLGYAPAFMAFLVDSTTNQLVTYGGIYPVAVDDADLWWRGADESIGAGSLTLYYYIFSQPLIDNTIYPVSSTVPESKLANQEYGLKVANANARAFSGDLKDYSMSTQAMMLQIQRAYQAAKTINPQGFTHGLDYYPMFLPYYRLTGETLWKMLDAQNQELSIVASTSLIYVWGLNNVFDVSVIVLKDPYVSGE